MASLDREGLKPSPAADRRTLIRRVTFDVIGLPPTPDEIAAFESDTRPDAYERLVDRLLQSPLHGRRRRASGSILRDIANPRRLDARSQIRGMALSRLGDHGDERGYAVRPLRAVQLAADRVADARPGDAAALGFLGLSPDYWKELQLDKDIIKGIVADEWEERIGAVSSGFLGLTVACARCHDHKFEPITRNDYYALAGVIASTRMTDREVLPEPPARRPVFIGPRRSDRQGSRIAELEKSNPPRRRQAQDSARKAIRGNLLVPGVHQSNRPGNPTHAGRADRGDSRKDCPSEKG